MRLLIAVLRDAINLYARTRGRKAHREVEQFEEVNSWFEATGARGLFAFENVCEVLGIDPGRLRRWLKSLHAAGAVAVPGPTAAGRLRSGRRMAAQPGPAAPPSPTESWKAHPGRIAKKAGRAKLIHFHMRTRLPARTSGGVCLKPKVSRN